jgi:hypothetical protein
MWRMPLSSACQRSADWNSEPEVWGSPRPRGNLLEHVLDELNGGLLIESVIDAQDPQPGAVVEGSELVEALIACSHRSLEFMSI